VDRLSFRNETLGPREEGEGLGRGASEQSFQENASAMRPETCP
jgi:hypothetical protein